MTTPNKKAGPMRDREQAWDGLEKAQCMTCGSKMLSLKLTPLAAAAPDLLEAAKEAIREVDEARAIFGASLALLPLRSAISKAEAKASRRGE